MRVSDASLERRNHDANRRTAAMTSSHQPISPSEQTSQLQLRPSVAVNVEITMQRSSKQPTDWQQQMKRSPPNTRFFSTPLDVRRCFRLCDAIEGKHLTAFKRLLNAHHQDRPNSLSMQRSLTYSTYSYRIVTAFHRYWNIISDELCY